MGGGRVKKGPQRNPSRRKGSQKEPKNPEITITLPPLFPHMNDGQVSKTNPKVGPWITLRQPTSHIDCTALLLLDCFSTWDQLACIIYDLQSLDLL